MGWKDVRTYFGDRQVSLARKGLALVAVAYAVMPFDFLPEALLGPIGLLDDLGVIAAVTAFFWRDVKRHAAGLASRNATK